MPLKLFVSHSSRLRDDETSDAQAQANWQLLLDLPGQIEQVYGSQVEVLVDHDALRAGDDWETVLHGLLWDCDAALIVFSRRAVEESDWVKLEAAVLGSRAMNDPGFHLVPVLLAGQTTVADLDQGYFAALRLKRLQAIPEVNSAQEIVARLRPILGEPETLFSGQPSAYRQTCTAVEAWLVRNLGQKVLEALWDKLCPGSRPCVAHPDRATRYARSIATHLLENGEDTLRRTQKVFDHLLCSGHNGNHCAGLLKCLNAQWINPNAAACLTEKEAGAQSLVLNGAFLASGDPDFPERPYYTLNRYLKRAWPETRRFQWVPIARIPTDREVADEVCEQLRAQLCRGSRANDEALRRRLSSLRADDWQIVVFITPTLWPDRDARLVDDLRTLHGQYQGLLVVLGIDDEMPAGLPEGVRVVDPALNLLVEEEQHDRELDTWDLIKNS